MKHHADSLTKQDLFINKNQISQEIPLLQIEESKNPNLGLHQSIESSYNKGKQDMLNQFLKDLSKIFVSNFSSDSYDQVLIKIEHLFKNKEYLNVIQNVECSLNELYSLLNDTEKVIQLTEQEISNEGKVKLGKLKLNVRVKNNENVIGSKEDLSKLFTEKPSKALEYPSAPVLDPINLDDFSLVYPDVTQHENIISEEFSYRNLSSMSTQEMIALSYQRHQKKLLKEKEWENREAKLLKEKYKRKKRLLKLRKNQHSEIEKHLKRKNLEIEKERAEIERIRDNYNREKKRILLSYENKSRKISEFINDLTLSVENSEALGRISPITETDMFSDVSYISDSETSFDTSMGEPDLSSIQRRIQDLESQYRTEASSETQERLKKDIDNLKNSYTNIRSAQVLKNSNRNFKRFNFTKTISLSEISSKRSTPVPQSLGTPRLSLNSNRSLFKTNTITPKAVSQNFMFNDIFPVVPEEESDAKRFLRIKEAKFAEKEERFDKERDSWMQKWSKLPDANVLIPMVQNEILEYRKRCCEYDRRINELDKKEFQLECKENDIKKKEKEIEGRLKEASEHKIKLDDSKSRILSKLERLREEIDR